MYHQTDLRYLNDTRCEYSVNPIDSQAQPGTDNINYWDKMETIQTALEKNKAVNLDQLEYKYSYYTDDNNDSGFEDSGSVHVSPSSHVQLKTKETSENLETSGNDDGDKRVEDTHEYSVNPIEIQARPGADNINYRDQIEKSPTAIKTHDAVQFAQLENKYSDVKNEEKGGSLEPIKKYIKGDDVDYNELPLVLEENDDYDSSSCDEEDDDDTDCYDFDAKKEQRNETSNTVQKTNDSELCDSDEENEYIDDGCGDDSDDGCGDDNDDTDDDCNDDDDTDDGCGDDDGCSDNDDCSDDDDTDNDCGDENSDKNNTKNTTNNGFNYLKCMYTNAEGILSKLDKFKHRVSVEQPDIISVVETWVQTDQKSKKYCPSEALEIDGYNLWRKDNSEEIRGGILTYISEKIVTSQDKNINKISSDFKESSWIVLSVDNVQVLYGVVYRKGKCSAANNSILRDILTKACRKYTKVLICGDFNHPEINWKDGNIKGKKFSPQMRFYDCLLDNYLTQHVMEPTRVRGTQKPSLLDLVITEDSQTQVSPSVDIQTPLGNSDHAVITWNYLVSTTVSKKCTETPEERPNFNKGDYKTLNEDLTQINWKELFDEKTLDECVEIFYNEIERLSNIHVPKKKYYKKSTQPPWMNRKAKKCIRKKYCAWNRYQKSQSFQAYVKFTQQRNKTAKILRKTKQQFEKKLAEECKRNPKALFKYANFKNKTKKNVIRLKDKNGNILTEDKENANLLNDFFQSIHTEESDAENIRLGHTEHLPNSTLTSNHMPDIKLTKEMISEQLKKLDPNKSNLPSCVHPRLIKECSDTLIDPLYHIYYLSLKTGTIPSKWKHGDVTPLFKDDDRHKASNYRPITLTSVLSRTLERIIKKQLMTYLIENDTLSKDQHGFLNRRSCLSNLLESIEEITALYDEGLPVDEIFLDLSKAFDKVPHQRLLYKIQNIGITGNLLKWIESFLIKRRQRVRINGTYSDWCDVRSGVPQGSVLGPILFILYINDLPDTIKSSCKIFADDTKLIQAIRDIKSTQQLQEDLDALQKWSETWKLEFNASKCKVLHIGKKNPKTSYSINNRNLTSVKEEKDLGCIMSTDLKQYSNIKHHVTKANVLLGMIRRTFTYLPKESFLLLYKAYIRPRLEYCQQAFYPYLKKDCIQLEKVQRRATKLVKDIADLPYDERLTKLGLFSLKYRRDRADMITTFKLVNGYIDINTDKLFTFAPSTNSRRSHSLKLKLPKICRSDLRRHTFSNRIVLPWNQLPDDVVLSTDVDTFKRRYDKMMSVKT